MKKLKAGTTKRKKKDLDKKYRWMFIADLTDTEFLNLAQNYWGKVRFGKRFDDPDQLSRENLTG